MIQKTIAEKAAQKFVDLYGHNPIVVKSPGRINIIGEHTDCNEGFVLPAAIDGSRGTATQRRRHILARDEGGLFVEYDQPSVGERPLSAVAGIVCRSRANAENGAGNQGFFRA